MTVILLVVLATLTGGAVTGEEVARGPDLLAWHELPELPDAFGFAAPFSGVSGGALIVAGGANFPHAPPWEGGQKVWHDRIFFLPSSDGDSRWRVADQRLARPNAYGVNLGVFDAVVCLGGCGQKWNEKHQGYDFQACYDDSFVMRRTGDDVEIGNKIFSHQDDASQVLPLPKLPRPLAFMGGCVIGETIYLVGGQEQLAGAKATKNFWQLDLSKRNSDKSSVKQFCWKELPWPEGAPSRVLPVVAAQSDGRETCLFMISGRDAPGHGAKLLTDAWKYTPSKQAWSRVSDAPRCLMAGVAINIGVSHILTIGGDSGENFDKDLRDDHPGFAKDAIYLYDAVTDRWTQRGELPANHVTTSAVLWNDMIVIPSGEIRPGVRSPKVWAATLIEEEQAFGTADWIVMGLYMGVMVAIGFYFSRGESSTDDFFLAGRRVPWWAAGLSIFATMLSAITYLSIPAKSFNTDWTWFLVNMGIVAIAPVAAFVFLPFFRRLNVTTAYEYLERRFSLGIRIFGSLSFIAFQIGRMAIVLFLPALAVSAVTGIDVMVCIIVMGVLSTIYTVLGGIEAVIWTDVLQSVVLVGGALAAVVIIVSSLDGGMTTLVSAGQAADKFRLAHFEWSFTGDALLVIVLGAVFAQLVPYTSDQAVVQRYLTTSDEAGARRAIWTNAVLSIVASVLFFGVGTGLFVYYQTFPERLAPLANGDQIFPWFIAHQMPWGLAGLVIAGVFAASMSSLDSSMHSISTAVTTDFVQRLGGRQQGQKRLLLIARLIVVLMGVIGTASALYLATLADQNLWERFMGYMGLVGGTVAGLFMLGAFTRRAGAVHATIGAAASVALLSYLKYAEVPMAGLLNAAVAIITCVTVGWLASWVIPAAPPEVAGLTIYTVGSGKHE